MRTPSELLQSINDFLPGVTAGRTPASLYEPIRYVLSMGGKRIRPTLMLMAYNMYKDDPESILPVACGLETYHNYTLLHDDLMDHAPVRRGKQTVHEKWNANTAILSGDTMLVMAYELISEAVSHPSSKERAADILALFTKTAIEIGEGQQYDMDFETRADVTEEEYMEMIRLKTSVLIACALKMGAMLGGAPASDSAALYEAGIRIGLAFQLQDDYLDVYGDPCVFGKKTGGDILCDKKTFMLINAYSRADEPTRDELRMWMEAKSFDPREKISAVTAIYDKVGVGELAMRKIAGYYDESRECLAQVNVPEERKRVLSAYTGSMVRRES